MGNSNYKAYLRVFILIFFVSSLLSCTPDPQETLGKYLELTYKENKPDKAYKLLSTDDQKFKSEEEFILDHKRKNLFHDRLRQKYEDQYAFEISEEFTLGDTVRLKAVLYKPSSDIILKEMLVFAMASSSTMNEIEKERFLEKHYESLIKEEQSGLITEEKEFILIRENGKYKIFLNFGEPYRKELLYKKLDELDKQAEERIRRMDYKEAISIYREMLSLNKNDENILQKIKDVNETLCQQVRLGEKIKIGNLYIKPLKIEVKNIAQEKKNWLGGEPRKEISEDKYFVLTFLVSNQFEGEFFNLYEEGRYKRHHSVRDNYGNEMNQYLPDFDVVSLEDNPEGKLIPGETRIMKAVCEAPLSGRAEKFIWRMKVVVDNRNSMKEIQVAFNRDEINFFE